MTTSPTGTGSMEAPTTVSEDSRLFLSGLAVGDVDVVQMLGIQEAEREASGLDPRTFALTKIAALIALDAPPASFVWQVGAAVASGVSAEDIAGVLMAIAPQVGIPKVVAAAPEIMLALGLTLPDEPTASPQSQES